MLHSYNNWGPPFLPIQNNIHVLELYEVVSWSSDCSLDSVSPALQLATSSSSLGLAFKVISVINLLFTISVLSLQRFGHFVGASDLNAGNFSVLMEFCTPSSVLAQDYVRLVYRTKCLLHTLDDFLGS